MGVWVVGGASAASLPGVGYVCVWDYPCATSDGDGNGGCVTASACMYVCMNE